MRINIAALIAIGTLLAIGVVVELKLIDAPKVGGCRLSARPGCAHPGFFRSPPP